MRPTQFCASLFLTLLSSLPEVHALSCLSQPSYNVISHPPDGIPQVTFDRKPIAGVDVPTFETIGKPTPDTQNRCAFNPQYARDKFSIFYKGLRIAGADVASFTVVSEFGIGRDQSRDYCGPTPLPDGERLRPLPYPNGYLVYFKSSSMVCKLGEKLSILDPASFELYEDRYTRDKKAIYCDDKILSDADPETFEFEPSYDYTTGQRVTANDAAHAYEDCKKVGQTRRVSLAQRVGDQVRSIFRFWSDQLGL